MRSYKVVHENCYDKVVFLQPYVFMAEDAGLIA